MCLQKNKHVAKVFYHSTNGTLPSVFADLSHPALFETLVNVLFIFTRVTIIQVWLFSEMGRKSVFVYLHADGGG